MEDAWLADGGANTSRNFTNTAYYVSVGYVVVQDSCGRVRSVPKR